MRKKRERNPRITPRKGDHLAKVVTFRANGVRVIQARLVLSVKGNVVTYTPKRAVHRCTRLEWQVWAHHARLVADCDTRSLC